MLKCVRSRRDIVEKDFCYVLVPFGGSVTSNLRHDSVASMRIQPEMMMPPPIHNYSYIGRDRYMMAMSLTAEYEYDVWCSCVALVPSHFFGAGTTPLLVNPLMPIASCMLYSLIECLVFSILSKSELCEVSFCAVEVVIVRVRGRGRGIYNTAMTMNT